MNFYRLSLVVLVVLFFFGESAILPAINNIVPRGESVVIVDEKPADEYIQKTSKMAELITNQEDRIDICLINYEFSKRAEGYLDKNITGQQLNDIYVQVNKDYFNGRLSGKYSDYAKEINNLLIEIVGRDNGKLTKDQLRQINRYMLSLSWNIQNDFKN